MFHYSDLDFKLAERFTALVLGTDIFYQAQPVPDTPEQALRSEGLVPVNFSGVTPAKISSWQEAISELTQVYEAYRAEENPVRRNYMWQQIGSFIKICRWLSGEPVLYRELVRELMFIDENPVGKATEAYYRQMLQQALSAQGYQGDLKQQMTAYQQDRVVKGKDAVEELLRNQLKIAQERTVALGLDVAAAYEVTPQVLFGVPYNAYCDFESRAIYINGDVEYTEDNLKHLVCHEAFPGHMTHCALRKVLVEQGKAPADMGLVITNTASSPIFEGLADVGMDFIGWRDDKFDSIHYAFQALQAICGLNAAHMLHAEGKDKAEVKDYLLEHGFGSENWADARIRFISFPLRSPFIYSYWRGWTGVEMVWNQVPADYRQDFLSYLYNNMHSNDSLAQYFDSRIR